MIFLHPVVIKQFILLKYHNIADFQDPIKKISCF